MGGIRCMQRRAIESLRNIRDNSLPPIGSNIIFLLEDQRSLFPLGISVGVGTCSDIHGVNVLVLSEHDPMDNRLGANSVICEYAVLLRSPTEDEWQTSDCPTRSCLCVERLRMVSVRQSINTVVLSRTKVNRLYAKI